MNRIRPKASTLGVNPYSPGGIGDPTFRAAGASPAPGPVLDPRAVGLDGDVLDQLLKGRWQEGWATGHRDGIERAQGNYPGIFDEGFDKGAETGYQEARAELFSGLIPLLQETGADLATIAGETGSKKIKDVAVARIDRLKDTLEQMVGAVADPTAAGKPAP